MSEWHALTVDQTVQRLEADLRHGLSDQEAAARLERYGRNELADRSGPTRLAIFAEQFRDVMIWILLVAAFISGVLLNEWIDTWVILAIVVLNSALGYFQESRAADALAALKQLSAPEAVVLRAGVERVVANAEVVPGDVLVLAAGDRIPADARVIEAAPRTGRGDPSAAAPLLASRTDAVRSLPLLSCKATV